MIALNATLGPRTYISLYHDVYVLLGGGGGAIRPKFGTDALREGNQGPKNFEKVENRGQKNRNHTNIRGQ